MVESRSGLQQNAPVHVTPEVTGGGIGVAGGIINGPGNGKNGGMMMMELRESFSSWSLLFVSVKGVVGTNPGGRMIGNGTITPCGIMTIDVHGSVQGISTMWGLPECTNLDCRAHPHSHSSMYLSRSLEDHKDSVYWTLAAVYTSFTVGVIFT